MLCTKPVRKFQGTTGKKTLLASNLGPGWNSLGASFPNSGFTQIGAHKGICFGKTLPGYHFFPEGAKTDNKNQEATWYRELISAIGAV